MGAQEKRDRSAAALPGDAGGASTGASAGGGGGGGGGGGADGGGGLANALASALAARKSKVSQSGEFCFSFLFLLFLSFFAL